MSWVAKSGCARAQLSDPARPVRVKSACTPPSRVASGFSTNLASRTGPSSVMNDGTRSLPPSLLANATWGLGTLPNGGVPNCGFGLVPPSAGWIWQPPQLSRFIRGPRPSATASTSAKSSAPALKNAPWFAVKSRNALPAPASPSRTPGSRAEGSTEDAGSVRSRNKAAIDAVRISDATCVAFIFSAPCARCGESRLEIHAKFALLNPQSVISAMPMP